MRVFFYMLIMGICWGPSYTAIKLATIGFHPVTLTLIRTGLGFLIIAFYCWFSGVSLRPQVRLNKCLFAALLTHVIPYTITNWGQQYISSAEGSIVAGLIPLFTMLVSHFTTTDDRFSWKKVASLGLGMTGFFVLILPSIRESESWSIIGLALVSLGSLSVALGFVYVRRAFRGAQQIQNPMYAMLFSVILLLPISTFLPDFGIKLVGNAEVLSILFLAVFSTAIAFIVYYRLLNLITASQFSLVTYFAPVVGVTLGTVFLKEPLSMNLIVSLVLIICSIFLINYKKDVQTRLSS